MTANRNSHDNELVVLDKVADAAFLALLFGAGMGLNVEFESPGQGQKGCEEQDALQE